MFFTNVKTSLTDLLNPNHNLCQCKKALSPFQTLLPSGNSYPMSHALHIHKSKTKTEKYYKIFGDCFVDFFFSLSVVEVRTTQTGFTRNGQQINWGIIQCHNLAVLKVKLTVTLMSQNTLTQSMQRYITYWSLLSVIFM